MRIAAIGQHWWKDGHKVSPHFGHKDKVLSPGLQCGRFRGQTCIWIWDGGSSATTTGHSLDCGWIPCFGLPTPQFHVFSPAHVHSLSSVAPEQLLCKKCDVLQEKE